MNSTAGPPVFVALLFPRYARTEIPLRACTPPQVPDYSEGNTPVAKAPPGGQLPQQNAPFKPRRAQVDRRVPASLNLSRPAQSLCRGETVLSRTGMLAEAFAQARTTIAVADSPLQFPKARTARGQRRRINWLPGMAAVLGARGRAWRRWGAARRSPPPPWTGWAV